MAMLLKSHDAYSIAAQEDRSAQRYPLAISAMLRPSGSSGFQTLVTDLSLSGFAVRAITQMHPGTLCWLTLPGLSGLQAEIVWNDGNTVGCAFATLLNQAVLNSIIDRQAL
ncbi:MAG: PilZ protein [Sphingomonadales bacterium]|nr:PilZ protein [Sphingomonadales bacterium]